MDEGFMNIGLPIIIFFVEFFGFTFIWGTIAERDAKKNKDKYKDYDIIWDGRRYTLRPPIDRLNRRLR